MNPAWERHAARSTAEKAALRRTLMRRVRDWIKRADDLLAEQEADRP